MSMATLIDPQELVSTVVSYDDIIELASCGKVVASRVVITPDVAKLILENCNGRNRAVRGRNIGFLVQQMVENKFVFNGESIVFGDDLNLNNGQHRLQSCVKSGKPIEVLMVFGVAAEHFVTYDQVAPRSGSDVLSIDKRQNCSRLSATLKHLDNAERGRLGTRDISITSRRMDNSYVLELLERYKGVERSVSRCSHFPRLAPPSLAAALHYLFSRIDGKAADEFFDVVVEGLRIGREYDPRIAESASNLRLWLEKAAMGSRKAPHDVIANVWIKAWNGYRTGRVPKVLAFKSSEEQVPII